VETWREKNDRLVERCVNFASDVYDLFSTFPRLPEANELRKQVARSAGSIGANLQEAFGSHGQNDFSYCVSIARKEARETWFWLMLTRRRNWANAAKVDAVVDEAQQLVRILSAIAKSAKAAEPKP